MFRMPHLLFALSLGFGGLILATQRVQVAQCSWRADLVACAPTSGPVLVAIPA